MRTLFWHGCDPRTRTGRKDTPTLLQCSPSPCPAHTTNYPESLDFGQIAVDCSTLSPSLYLSGHQGCDTPPLKTLLLLRPLYCTCQLQSTFRVRLRLSFLKQFCVSFLGTTHKVPFSSNIYIFYDLAPISDFYVFINTQNYEQCLFCLCFMAIKFWCKQMHFISVRQEGGAGCGRLKFVYASASSTKLPIKSVWHAPRRLQSVLQGHRELWNKNMDLWITKKGGIPCTLFAYFIQSRKDFYLSSM